MGKYSTPDGYLSTKEAAARLGVERNQFARIARHYGLEAWGDPMNRNFRLYRVEDVEALRGPRSMGAAGVVTVAERPPETGRCPRGHRLERVLDRARGTPMLVCRACDYAVTDTGTDGDQRPALPGFALDSQIAATAGTVRGGDEVTA